MSEIGTVTASEWSMVDKITYALRRAPERLKNWLVHRLLRIVVLLIGDTNSITFAKRELRAKLEDPEDGPDKWIAQNLIALVHWHVQTAR